MNIGFNVRETFVWDEAEKTFLPQISQLEHERDSFKHERDSFKHERDSFKHERDGAFQKLDRTLLLAALSFQKMGLDAENIARMLEISDEEVIRLLKSNNK